MSKRIGLIGGIGPESTIAYYRLLVEGARRALGTEAYPEFAIESIDMTAMLDLVGAADGDRTALVDFLAERVRRLVDTGAEVVAMASNTPHIAFDELDRRVDVELVSIVEATCQAIASRGHSRVALLGTGFTMRGGFYQSVAGGFGIEVVTPSPADQEFVHDRYMTELVNNVIEPATKTRLVEIVETIRTASDLDGLILGGTELPLILGAEDFDDIDVFDTTQLHCQAILDRAGYAVR